MADICQILRQAVVKSAAARQLNLADRVNLSGIAATTGIPRSEISRILRKSEKASVQLADSRKQSTNLVLSAWHEQPRFTTPNGEPADLKIYGRGNSFDQLVKKYGKGIPTRAMLDELVRARAAVLLPSQKVRAKSRVAIDFGVSRQVIKSFGDHVTELMETLISNMRVPDRPLLVASVSGVTSEFSLLKREISKKGVGFLADVKEGLRQPKVGYRARSSNKISVTVFIHDGVPSRSVAPSKPLKRQNLRRQSRFSRGGKSTTYR